VFDNLFDNQIKELIWPFVQQSFQGDIDDPQNVADVIAKEADKLGADPEYLSPFAKNAKS